MRKLILAGAALLSLGTSLAHSAVQTPRPPAPTSPRGGRHNRRDARLHLRRPKSARLSAASRARSSVVRLADNTVTSSATTRSDQLHQGDLGVGYKVGTKVKCTQSTTTRTMSISIQHRAWIVDKTTGEIVYSPGSSFPIGRSPM